MLLIIIRKMYYYYTRLTTTFSRTTLINQYQKATLNSIPDLAQKGRTSLDLNVTRDDGVLR